MGGPILVLTIGGRCDWCEVESQYASPCFALVIFNQRACRLVLVRMYYTNISGVSLSCSVITVFRHFNYIAFVLE